jgi:hypothetical protein
MRTLACVVFVVCLGFSGIATAMSGGGGGAAGGGGTGISSAEFPGTGSRDLWVRRRARPCTTNDIEFHSLKLTQHLCNATCRPLTLWPSDCYAPCWAGREAWVTYGDGRTRQVPENAAKGSTPLMAAAPLSCENRKALSMPREGGRTDFDLAVG